MPESKHTPGPWVYEPGGGHAHNRIVGSESIQVGGWPERVGGISNASYSSRVCENLGDTSLPGPAANARLIAAAPALLEALRRAERVLGNGEGLPEDCPDTYAERSGCALGILRAALAAAEGGEVDRG